MTTGPEILTATRWPSEVRPHTMTFVRHAEKAGQGFYSDLTAKGSLDALDAGRRIGCGVDLFISSPSPRTVSTAQCLRSANGSSAPIVQNPHLANPGLGEFTGFRDAMSSMFASLAGHVRESGSEVVIATTHDYVVGYVAQFFGGRVPDASSFLCGVTVDLDEILRFGKGQ